MDLTKQRLDWKLHDLAKDFIESSDKYGGNFQVLLNKYLNLVETRYEECDVLIRKYPGHPILSHNYQVLAITWALLEFSSNSDLI